MFLKMFLKRFLKIISLKKTKKWILGSLNGRNNILPQSPEQICSSNDDIWQIPKRAVKAPRRLQKQDLYKKRYRCLREGSKITVAEE